MSYSYNQGPYCPSCKAPAVDGPADRPLLCVYCGTLIRGAQMAGPQAGVPQQAPPVWSAGPSPMVPTFVPPKRNSVLPLVLVAIIFLVLGAGVAGFLLFRSSASDTDAKPAASAKTSKDGGSLSPSAPSTSSDIEFAPITVTWNGKIHTSSGDAPPVGTACTLTVKAHREKQGTDIEEDFMTLACGKKMLYDSQQPLAGMSMDSFYLHEIPLAGEVSAFVYEVKADDKGQRSGDRNQISADTRELVVEAFRDEAPSFRVSVSIDKTSSERRGKSLEDDTVPLFKDVVSRKATVTSATGKKPFSTTTCDVRVSPAYRTKDTCRTTITCGGKLVFGLGTTGFEACVMEGGEPVSLVDDSPTPKDHDPELNLDLKANKATLADTLADGTSYSVTFRLE